MSQQSVEIVRKNFDAWNRGLHRDPILPELCRRLSKPPSDRSGARRRLS